MAVHSILSSPSGLSSASDFSCTSEKPSSNTSGTSKPVRSADRSSAGALMRSGVARTPSTCSAKACTSICCTLWPPRTRVRTTPVASAYSSTMWMLGLPTRRFNTTPSNSSRSMARSLTCIVSRWMPGLLVTR